MITIDLIQLITASVIIIYMLIDYTVTFKKLKKLEERLNNPYYKLIESALKWFDNKQNLINESIEFCNVPNNFSHRQVVDHCYNLYSKFEHEPKEGKCDTILEFYKHIFGCQYEMGIDYIQLLYQQPWQKLPVICLISSENPSGKSTFIKLQQSIFTDNCIIIGNYDLDNQFNYSWAGKLLICSHESLFDKKINIEILNNLIKSDRILVNRRGINLSEIDFFGKFIMASNNDDDFINACKNDEQYWVIKVPKIIKLDPWLLEKMITEIPAFLHFLNTRELCYKNQGRFWFK